MNISNRLLSAISIVQNAQTKLVSTSLKELNPSSPATGNANNYSGDPSSTNFGVSGRSFNPESNLPGGQIQSGVMEDCPTELSPGEVPGGFTPYDGNPAVFHCGFEGIKEDRIPTVNDPQNECFYDDDGNLVDENHEYAGCAGSPNQYDAEANPIAHTILDDGGILNRGAEGFAESVNYAVDSTIDTISDTVESVVDSVGDTVDSVVDTVSDTVESAVDSVSDFASSIGESISDFFSGDD